MRKIIPIHEKNERGSRQESEAERQLITAQVTPIVSEYPAIDPRLSEIINDAKRSTKYGTLVDLLREHETLKSDIARMQRSRRKDVATRLTLLTGQIMNIEDMIARHLK